MRRPLEPELDISIDEVQAEGRPPESRDVLLRELLAVRDALGGWRTGNEWERAGLRPARRTFRIDQDPDGEGEGPVKARIGFPGPEAVAAIADVAWWVDVRSSGAAPIPRHVR